MGGWKRCLASAETLPIRIGGSPKLLRGNRHGCALPVRVGQNEMIDQMRERLPVDRDAQLPAMREVRLTQLTRPVFLCEENFARRPFRCPPVPDSTPQSPHLSILEPLGIRPLQMLKQRFRLQVRLRAQQLSNLFPRIRKRVWPRSPCMLLSHFARQSSLPQVFPRRFRVHARLCCRGLHR